MTFFSKEEYLAMLLNAPTLRMALAGLRSDINNRTTCAIMNLEVLYEDFDDLEKTEILEMASAAKNCIRDILPLLDAVSDYAQSIQTQSPKTND